MPDKNHCPGRAHANNQSNRQGHGIDQAVQLEVRSDIASYTSPQDNLKTTSTPSPHHVRVELALQKPPITHEPRMVQLPNLEDRLFYERLQGIRKIMAANPW